MYTDQQLGKELYQTNDVSDWVKDHVKPMQGALIIIGAALMGVGIFFILTNLQNSMVIGFSLLSVVAGLFIVLSAYASSGRIIRVAVYERGLRFWCVNGITNTISYAEIQRITHTPNKISIFMPARPNQASYYFKAKYVTDLPELYGFLTHAFEAYKHAPTVAEIPADHLKDPHTRAITGPVTPKYPPLNIKKRMRYSFVFGTYFYVVMIMSLMISGRFNETPISAILRTWYIVFIPIAVYLMVKFFHKKRAMTHVSIEAISLILFLITTLAVIIANTQGLGRNLLQYGLVILIMIIFGIIWWGAHSIIVHKNSLSFVVKTLTTYTGILLIKRKRLRNREFQRITNVLYMDCEPAQFIAQANHFLTRPDVPEFERIALQNQISYAHGTLGEYDQAISKLQQQIQELTVESAAFVGLKKGYLYDTLIKWTLRKDENHDITHLKNMCKKLQADLKDELFPYSQSLEAFINGEFSEVLAIFEKRHQVSQEKNLNLTNLGKVEEYFDKAHVYEQIGELGQLKSALKQVVALGGSTIFATQAREKLAELGENVEEVQTELAKNEQPEPKKVSIAPLIIILLIVMGLWFFIRNI